MTVLLLQRKPWIYSDEVLSWVVIGWHYCIRAQMQFHESNLKWPQYLRPVMINVFKSKISDYTSSSPSNLSKLLTFEKFLQVMTKDESLSISLFCHWLYEVWISRRSSNSVKLCVHPFIHQFVRILRILDFIQGCHAHASNLRSRNTIKVIWSGKFAAMFQS